MFKIPIHSWNDILKRGNCSAKEAVVAVLDCCIESWYDIHDSEYAKAESMLEEFARMRIRETLEEIETAFIRAGNPDHQLESFYEIKARISK